MYKPMLPLKGEGDRNSPQGLRNKSLGLGVMQTCRGHRAVVRKETWKYLGKRKKNRMSKGGREKERGGGRGECNKNNGMRMEQNSRADSKDELKLVDDMSCFWKSENILNSL